MSETTDLTYYQKICDSKIERDVMLNRSKDYYQNNKERLRVQARDKYRNSSEEKKIKTENMGRIDIAICLEKRSKE